ncbi:isoprenylcysteine carboxylmethyltransferase family protein [Leucobacter luti]|uniref:methyltransferase family protein n=1 Tax=Leucobacter luti TaxID=340320 RepID=UPI001C68FAB9|nr:isoprenylcysteine carboxylmethyltransferase family protein [Leucobacter luti]QYM74832.1 isoprenylcysteine carboxylmethyltransferase family protein [Leucobacter luti]
MENASPRAAGPWFLRDRRVARGYFAVQAAAGALWWIGVFTLDGVRLATLGGLDPVLVFWLDLPLFVCASALAAAGIRSASAGVACWSVLVTVGMVIYATVTGLAGWGALVMLAAAVGSTGAALILWVGRVPSEWLISGPFAFRTARVTKRASLLWLTAAQTSVFWVLFLGVFPAAIVLLERRWDLAITFPPALRLIGIVLFLAGSVLGIWSAVTMATRGRGTPLPAAMTTELVIAGPFRFVRNPMALGSITQGIAVGLMAGSWLIVLYALAGALIWDWLIRPHEEANLSVRFDEAFERYRRAVRCWIPTWRRIPSGPATTRAARNP